MTALLWTAPYCGVQHLTGHPELTDRTYQVTLTDRGSFADWYILALHGNHPFNSLREGIGTDVVAAKQQAESAFLAIVQ
jgi:hypothetical protein